MKTNWTHLARYIGVSDTFFSAMRRTNKDKFDFVLSFHTNPYKSVDKYAIYVSKIVSQMERILNFFEHKKYLFGSMVRALGLSNVKNHTRIYDSYSFSVFKINDKTSNFFSIKHTTLIAWNTIIKHFERLHKNTA